MAYPYIVVFDGECNFCNGAVNFIIKRDPDAKFAFVPMQSELAAQIIKQHLRDHSDIDTLLLIKNDQCLMWSNAAMEIARELRGFWYLSLVFKVVPRPIRDVCYKTFARHRYRLFGRRPRCMVPTEEIRSRFIGL